MIGWNEILQDIIYFISLFYVVFWILVLLDRVDVKQKKLSRYPTVTIAVPAYNEEKNITETLASVVALDYPKDKITLIFIDDGSKDKTYALAKSALDAIRKTHTYRSVLCLRQKNAGKHTAMNRALKHTDTEFFASLDADSFPAPDALRNIMATFRTQRIAAVSSVLKVHSPKNTLQLVQWFEYGVNHFYKSIISRMNSIHVLPGPLSVYRTSVFREVGGFREAHKTEDMEIAMRIQSRHYAIVQCDTAFVTTKAPYTLKELYRQRHRWNYGTFRNLVDYRRMMFRRKYGDFGMFQLPMILCSGLLGLTILYLIIYDLIKQIRPHLAQLSLYGYNIIEYASHLKFTMIWLDVDLRSLVTFIGFFAISMVVMYLSLKFYREKYSMRRSFGLLLYLFLSYIFLAVVWLGVFKDIVLRKGTEWSK